MAVNRIFDNADIDTERLIWMSYILDYDFLRNVYLPYMAVNKDEIIANDSIFDLRSIRFKPEIISVVMEKQTDIYHKIKSQE